MVDRHVAEQGDLRFHLVGNRIFAPADQNIRLKAHALQLFDAGLGRFRFQLLGCFQIRNQGHMDQNGVFMAYVVLELTEVTRIDADLQAVKMQALMRSGGKLALDDYGSGYNGEAMLLAVQPDYVKIDVAIVRGVDQDDDKRQLVENLVSYAHVRGIALVGEGVETRAELEALAALGVDYVQGYFLARPALLPPPVTPEGAQCLRVLRGEMD